MRLFYLFINFHICSNLALVLIELEIFFNFEVYIHIKYDEILPFIYLSFRTGTHQLL